MMGIVGMGVHDKLWTCVTMCLEYSGTGGMTVIVVGNRGSWF